VASKKELLAAGVLVTGSTIKLLNPDEVVRKNGRIVYTKIASMIKKSYGNRKVFNRC